MKLMRWGSPSWRRILRLLLLAAAVAAAVLVVATPAESKDSRDAQIHQQLVRYYHAQGVIRSIGKVAYRTIYNSNPQKRHKWKKATRWLFHVRADARAKIDALREPPHPVVSDDGAEFSCIHSKEGSWKDPNGPYYGGLQMDLGFQATYGPEFLRRWGTADHWPVWAQVTAARRARDGYNGNPARGYNPWPNTARECGQL